jgi:hypothetical protein
MHRFALIAGVTLVSATTFAHEGAGNHRHDDGPAPEAPVQPQDSPTVQPAVATTEVAPAAVAESSSGSQSPSSSGPPPASDGGDTSFRPRTIQDTSWRRRIRDTEESQGSKFVDSDHFFFEIRFGPYWPEVDQDFGGDGPYTEFFGDGPKFYFGLEVDYLPIYIPYVVSLGPGFGWGFTKASGSARLREDGSAVDGVDTNLTIFPMHLSAVARFDGPLREMDIPLVPYVKAGLGFGVWRSGGGEQDGSGNSGGLHLAVGGSIALNAFDPQTAMAMQADTGIRFAHVWGEWMWANLDSGLNIGTSTAIFGIGLEL